MGNQSPQSHPRDLEQPGAKCREAVKRGPKPGSTCDRALAVGSWREHREAGRFADWLTAVLDELARDAYPQNRLGGKGRQAMIAATEALQSKTIDGMARFALSDHGENGAPAKT